MVPMEEGIRLGTILASILAAVALYMSAETAQRHEMSEHEEELAGDLFFSGIVSLVAAATGIVYFVALGHDADEQILPGLFFLYLIASVLFLVFSVRLVILASIETKHVRDRLSQSIVFLALSVIVAVIAAIVG